MISKRLFSTLLWARQEFFLDALRECFRVHYVEIVGEGLLALIIFHQLSTYNCMPPTSFSHTTILQFHLLQRRQRCRLRGGSHLLGQLWHAYRAVHSFQRSWCFSSQLPVHYKMLATSAIMRCFLLHNTSTCIRQNPLCSCVFVVHFCITRSNWPCNPVSYKTLLVAIAFSQGCVTPVAFWWIKFILNHWLELIFAFQIGATIGSKMVILHLPLNCIGVAHFPLNCIGVDVACFISDLCWWFCFRSIRQTYIVSIQRRRYFRCSVSI